jgi:phenylacetate-coenzyme A ligase PaaK-like adenylate-forming protein
MSLVNTLPPYAIAQDEKERYLLSELSDLTHFHVENCDYYKQIVERNRGARESYSRLEDLPFLPVRLFKHLELLSVENSEIVKTVTSSGTTGQSVSKIFLDRETSASQIRILVKILQSFLGTKRLPMLIVDHPKVIKDRASFSARGAGILGISNFGVDHTYVLNDRNMEIEFDTIANFLDKYANSPILLFGFTFMVWQYLIRSMEQANKRIKLDQGILLHSGGWKKLESEAVDNETFKQRLKEITGINRVHNFYGMAEQVGTIYVECEFGRLHTPTFSEVLVRDPRTWKALPIGQKGLIQLLSILPRSYPGHSILTEDIGEILGIDDCRCGRMGKTIKIHGRIAKAEVRGCSDTHNN